MNKQSMLKWIATNKVMSLSQKFSRLKSWANVRLGDNYRQGLECTLVYAFDESCQPCYSKLLRRIELLEKKGYIVLLAGSIIETKPLIQIDQSRQVEVKSKVQLSQSIRL